MTRILSLPSRLMVAALFSALLFALLVWPSSPSPEAEASENPPPRGIAGGPLGRYGNRAERFYTDKSQ